MREFLNERSGAYELGCAFLMYVASCADVCKKQNESVFNATLVCLIVCVYNEVQCTFGTDFICRYELRL